MPKENPFGITFEKRKERKDTNERRRNENCFPVGSGVCPFWQSH